MFDLYRDDEQTQEYLMKLFRESSAVCFSKLTDRSAISTLNRTQSVFANDGYRFYDFLEDGILRTKEINRLVNTGWLFTQKNSGETEYFYPAEKFKKLLEARYGNENSYIEFYDNSGMLN